MTMKIHIVIKFFLNFLIGKKKRNFLIFEIFNKVKKKKNFKS